MVLGSFGSKPPQPLHSDITFEEAYCYSAGLEDAKTYEIAKGTTELRFSFPDAQAFWDLYVTTNQYLDPTWLELYRDEKAIFVTMLVNDQGQYMQPNGIDADGTIVMNADVLRDFGAGEPLRTFGDGVISIGFYELGAFKFNVLWMTMYKSV